MGSDVRAMTSRRSVVVIALLASSTMGCKLKLEAKVTGPAPGAPDKVKVHVEADGAEVSCSNDACTPTKVYYSQDIDVKIPTSEPKTVTLTAKKGLRRGTVTLDLGAGGAGSKLEYARGQLTCLPVGCKGRIDVSPSAKISFEAPPGTTIEVGGEKLTVPASGTLNSPLKLVISPPIDKQPLDKVCTGTNASGTIFTSTTVAVTMPGKSPMTTKVDIDGALVEQGLSIALAEVKKGAVVFPWEKPGQAATGKRAAVYTDGGYCYDAGTPGATVADLDIIAVGNVETRDDKCTYTLTNGAGNAEAPVTLYDIRATAYDRVSGRTLSTKLFNAPKNCTESISVRAGSSASARQSFSADKDVIGKWAATFAK